MPREVAHIADDIWNISSPDQFNALALEIFHHQMTHCAPYLRFCQALGKTTAQKAEDIPFLPISAFKTHQVRSFEGEAEMVFRSSGTTSNTSSAHYVSSLSHYVQSFRKGFELFYGQASDYCILALLPSYLERKGSSLVQMVDQLIQDSGHADSGFYLHDIEGLYQKLMTLKASQTPTLLFGVSFALLDMAEKYRLNFPELTVIETGGMKGRREELTRESLHKAISDGFGVQNVHSEYGMTELMSQAYSHGQGLFESPPWMRVSGRQMSDPLSPVQLGRTGGLNIMDLANIYSCSFIATDDLGRVYDKGRFEVLGRFDQSDIRGCSLLVL